MYIKSCYIENFGKFHEFNIEFERGLNVIKEDNGWGKTTFMAFIKAMLYGMTYRPNAKEFYDRRRYEPWGGGKFGGYMVFEADGKEYKVTRFFGKKDVQDEFELTDMSTGKASDAYSEKLGEELFGIDMDSFERSVFISGNRRAAITDGINAKLNNLIENADDIGNFDKAYDNLDKIIKNLHRRGGGGDIQKKTEQIKMLEEKCKDCDSKSEFIGLYQKNINEYTLKKQDCEQNISRIDDNIGKAELYNKGEQYKILRRRKAEAESGLSRLSRFFDKYIPTNEELTKYYNVCAEIDSINHGIEALGTVKECAEDEERRIDECVSCYKEAVEINNLLKGESAKYESLHEKCKELETEIAVTSEGRKGIVLKVIMLMLSLGVAGFGVFDVIKELIPYGIIFITVGAVIALLFTLLIVRILLRNKELEIRHRNAIISKAECEAGLEDIKKHAADLKKKGREYEAKYTGFINERIVNPTRDFIEDLSRIRENYNKYCRLLSYNRELSSKEKLIITFLEYYDYGYNVNASYYDKLQIIRDNLRDYIFCKENYAKLSDELASFEASNDIARILSIAGEVPEYVDIVTLQRERSIWQSEAEKLSGLINRAQKTIDDTSLEVDRKQEYESELARLKEEVTELEDKYKIFTLTRNTLEAAREKLSTRYMADMKAAFEKYLDIFGVSDNIKLGLELDTRLEKNGREWDSKYFSSGYADMADICVRLALVDAMFKEEKPMIVLDDPFVNFDDDKLSKVGKAIEILARDKQIIYTICSSTRKP